MKKRKVLVSLLCATALLGVSAGTLTSCKETDEPDPTPQVQKYVVTFDSKGGSAVTKIENITSDSTIAKPADPTKADSVFAGWYKDSNCTQAWNFESDTVTGNITLYAKWTAKGDTPVEKYTVTFDSKGGSAVTKLENIESGAKITKPTDPTQDGYLFAGWYKADPETDSNAVAWNFESDTVTANVTLYAKWTAETPVNAPKATLVYNNGAEDGTLTAVEDGGKFYYDRPADPSKEYNNFVDWYTDEKCTTAYIWNTEAVDGLKLYAKYEQKYDNIYTEFDFAAASEVIGAAATAEEKTVGRFTCAAGVRIDGGTTLNSQGKDITFELKGEGTGNGITVSATWASSTKVGSFFITNLDTDVVVKQIDNLKNKDSIEVNEMNLPAGHYKISSGASLKITALALTEKLPQGPLSGITLDVSSVQDQYLAGRAFSPEGLVVYLAYENGRKDELDAAKYSLSTVDMTTAGKKTVTVTYNKDAETVYTQTFDIQVYAIEELVVYTHVLDTKRITHNAQTLFALNGTFNSNNIAVKAKCLLEKAKPEDPQEYIEFILAEGEYLLTPADLTTIGTKSVKIEYKGDASKVANYDIEVVEIPDYSNEKFVVVGVDPTHELGAGQFGPTDAQQNCFYVQTINQALQFFELAKVTEDAEKAIGLKAGTTYHEKVEINVPNLMMATIDLATGSPVTEPADYAVIEFNGINGQLDPSETIGYETSGSATFSIRSTATNFQAKAVKFNNYWNTAERYQESLNIYGNGRTQAVAVLVEADKVTFANCYFSSYQDTLYAKNGRQYYYYCNIEGHTDFIFGDDATAVFDHCTIKTIGNGDEKNGGYVVATKGKTSGDKELKYGYVFDDCDFIADDQTVDGTTSLGRAWAAGMSMMVMNSRLGAHLSKEAYGNTESPKNDRYGKLSADPTAALILEYGNTGLGAVDSTMAETLVNTCTIVDSVADYTLNKIYGADNGSKQYSDVWMPAGYGNMDAVVNLVDQNGNPVQTIEGASYIGSTITESMLASRVEKIEGKTIVGYFSDQACTTPYDYSTVLGETNTIYVKVVEGVVMEKETFTASNEGYTAAVGTDGKAAGTDLSKTPYDGETFKVEVTGGGSKVATTGMTATAEDGSTFTTAFVPTGGGRVYTITAKRDVTIKVYYTISNTTGPMTTTPTVKLGNLTVNGTSYDGADKDYSTDVAYCYTITLKANETVTLTSSVNNVCLFGVVAEYAL